MRWTLLSLPPHQYLPISWRSAHLRKLAAMPSTELSRRQSKWPTLAADLAKKQEPLESASDVQTLAWSGPAPEAPFRPANAHVAPGHLSITLRPRPRLQTTARHPP